MNITKIRFHQAIPQVMERTFTYQPDYITQILIDDILQYNIPSTQLVGISHMQYQIGQWQIQLKYTDVLDSILDQNGLPIPMDQHIILNKYMLYVYLDNNVTIPLFITMQSCKVSIQDNAFSFKAINMIGVIQYYKNKNVTYLGLDAQEVSIPYKVKFNNTIKQKMQQEGHIDQYSDLLLTRNKSNSIIWDNLYDDWQLLLQAIYGTIIICIFTGNQNISPYYDQDGIYPYLANPYQMTVHPLMLIYDNTAGYVQSYFDLSARILPNGNLQDVINRKYWQDVRRISLSYGANQFYHYIYTFLYERVMIDFVHCINNDQDYQKGYTFSQLIDELMQAGYFRYAGGSSPYILYDSSEPSILPQTGQFVIGVQPTRPTWLDESNPYKFRYPENNSKTRKLVLQISKTARQNDSNNQLWVVQQYDVAMDNPSFLYNQYSISGIDVPTKLIKRQTDQTNNPFVNDDFICNQLVTKTAQNRQAKIEYGLISQDGTYNYIKFKVDGAKPLTDRIYFNNLPTPKFIHWKQGQDLSLIDMLNQLLLLQQVSVNTDIINGNTYGTTAIKKFLISQLYDVNINNFILVSQDYVQDYQFIPIVKQKSQGLNKYEVAQYDAIIDTMYKYGYDLLSKNYLVKISITIIGDTSINLTNNRYFTFKGMRFICTAMKPNNNNTMTIQGYGK